MKTLTESLLLAAQRTELTEHLVYARLADQCKDPHNAEVLRTISAEELKHAQYWESMVGKKTSPNRFRVFRSVCFAKILGITFTLKQMEKREGSASKLYRDLAKDYPEAAEFAEQEAVHEAKLLDMLDEERLQYVGSIVLGLNDALVELTGSLAGFTLALGNTRLISLAGLVTGISAAFSMAASDYLSSKSDGNEKAKKSALYTGVAYLVTVAALILPFLLSSDKFVALVLSLIIAVIIIFLFNYYLSVAKNYNFKQRFFEMAGISLGVAAFAFLIGYILKNALGISI